MKKFLCIAVSVILVAFSCTFFGCGGEAEVEYTLSDDGTYYIVSGVSGYKSALKEYEIPAEYTAEEGGTSLPVKEIGDSAFYGCTSLKVISIPYGITGIGELAFAMCPITAVSIPESVTEIAYGAFGMTSLKSVTVPDSVTSLGQLAFFCCSSMQKAEIYAQITDLKYKTLYNSWAQSGGNVYTSTQLTEVVLPATLERIESTALDGNLLETIYFIGTEEEWNAVEFYTLTTDDDGNTVEEAAEKDDVLSSDLVMVYNYNPNA